MEDESVVPAAAGRRILAKMYRALQWVLAAAAALIALLMLAEVRRLGIPGAPVLLFCLTIAFLVALAIIHSPPVFFRLAGKVKAGAYAGILAAMISLGSYGNGMRVAYERTPEGAKEAAEKRAWDAKVAAWDAQLEESERISGQFEKAKEADLAARAKVEKCLSLFGHFAPLENEVKGRLHNPDAFKHVETEAIGPTVYGDNLQMTFRAENGFGAVRTLTVKAKINPDTCELLSAGEPTVN